MKKVFTVYVFLIASILAHGQEDPRFQALDQIIALENGAKIHLTGGAHYDGDRGGWKYVIEFIGVVDALHIKLIYKGQEIVLPIEAGLLGAPSLGQPFGKEAKAWTEQYMKQSGIRISIYYSRSLSKYGSYDHVSLYRRLSYAEGLKAKFNENSFERGILLAGLAWILPDSGNSYWVEAQSTARVNFRGIWADPTPPWERYAKK